MQTKALLKKDISLIRTLLEWESRESSSCIEELETSYIQNIVIYLSDKQKKCDKYDLGRYDYNGLTSNEWIKVFRAELAYREKLNTPEKEKITY